MEQKRMKITDIEVKSLAIQEDNPTYAKYFKKHVDKMPKLLKPQRMSFVIDNVSIGVAAMIRYALCDELKVHALCFEYANYSCTDPHIIWDLVLARIRQIPIMQDVDTHSEYSLTIHNASQAVMTVYTRDLKLVKGKTAPADLTDGCIPLFDLQEGRSINITGIRVDTNRSYVYGGFKLACNPVALPLDQTPYDVIKKTGVPAAMANPRKHKFSFATNGTAPPEKIMDQCCGEIIERLEILRGVLGDIEEDNQIYILRIKNESPAFGHLLVKTISDQRPDITFVSYAPNFDMRELTLRLRTSDLPANVISNAIDYCVRVFTDIRKFFKV